MNNMCSLSAGALKNILQGQLVDNPIMQVLQSEKISSEEGRYRILLSDGLYQISCAIFITQIDKRVVLSDYSIIRIKRYNAGSTLVILDIEILCPGDEIKVTIGSPKTLPQIALQYHSGANLNTDNDPSENIVNNGSTSSSFRPKISKNDVNQNNNQLVCPLSLLHPSHNEWVIRALVINKSQIISYHNDRGPGKRFSFDLIDESGEIQVLAFRSMVDKFYNTIEVNKFYYIRNCNIQRRSKNFRALENDYELTLSNTSVIEPCCEETARFPQIKYHFIIFSEIDQKEVGALIDIVGVCESDEFSESGQFSAGYKWKKREITLIDITYNRVILILWGNEAQNFEGKENPVVTIKRAKLEQYNGRKQVSLDVNASIMKIDPHIPEAQYLRSWFDNHAT